MFVMLAAEAQIVVMFAPLATLTLSGGQRHFLAGKVVLGWLQVYGLLRKERMSI